MRLSADSSRRRVGTSSPHPNTVLYVSGWAMLSPTLARAPASVPAGGRINSSQMLRVTVWPSGLALASRGAPVAAALLDDETALSRCHTPAVHVRPCLLVACRMQ